MSLCPAGSEPDTGAAPYVWVSWIDARTWLDVLWGRLGWVGVATTAILYETAVFCATEPEQPTYPGDATVLAAAHDPVAFEQLLTYIRESATWWVWSHTCVCSAAAAGACYSLMPTTALPNTSSDVVNLQFGYEFYAKISGLICYGFTVRFSSVGAGTFKARFADQTDVTIYEQNFAGVNGLHTYYFTTPQPLDHTGSGAVYDMLLAFPNSGYTFTYDNVNVTPNDTTQMHGNLFVSSAYPGSVSAWSPQHFPLDAVICLSPGPFPDTTTPDPPPPPDTDIPDLPSLECSTTSDLCELVNQLVVSVAQVRGQVDLIQRQEVPFSYLISTVHSGLTGSGSFSVQGMMGLLVQLATVPSFWGLTADNPARWVPSPGSVAVGTAIGDQDQHFCHLPEELWFPTNMGAMTTVSYRFKPGVTGAITELRREF